MDSYRHDDSDADLPRNPSSQDPSDSLVIAAVVRPMNVMEITRVPGGM